MTYTKWNFEVVEGKVAVCRGDHEKWDPCDYRQLEPEEVVDILESFKRAALR